MWQSGGVCGGGHAWQGACVTGGMHGRGCAWQGGMCSRSMHGGGHAWQERRPLQRTVRILLECILVINVINPLSSYYTMTSICYRTNTLTDNTKNNLRSEGTSHLVARFHKLEYNVKQDSNNPVFCEDSSKFTKKN